MHRARCSCLVQSPENYENRRFNIITELKKSGFGIFLTIRHLYVLENNVTQAVMYHILYLDDEPDLLELCKLFLEENGDFLVDTAASPAAALGLIKTRCYDAIITDYQMPGMNGIAFLNEVQKDRPHLPSVLFSGKGHNEIAMEALNTGFDFYQQKYGDPETQFIDLTYKTLLAIRKRSRDMTQYASDSFSRIMATADYTAVLTDGGVFRYTSTAHDTIMGYTATSLVGKNPLDFIHPDDLDRVRRKRDEAVVNKQGEEPVPVRFRTATGYYHLLETKSMNCIDMPQIQGILVVSHDLGPCD